MTNVPIEIFVFHGASLATVGISLVVWAIGCVLAIRHRPTPGAMFLATGFGLLAFLTFIGGINSVRVFLFDIGLIERISMFEIDDVFGLSYYFIFHLGLQIVAAVLVVVGAAQSLRFAGRSL